MRKKGISRFSISIPLIVSMLASLLFMAAPRMAYTASVPARSASFGPNGTHWPSLISTPYMYDNTVPNIIQAACSWSDIATALSSVTPAQAAAGVLIKVAPGTLPAAMPALTDLGSSSWTKRVTICPRDGYGTVTLGADTLIRRVHGVCFAGFKTGTFRMEGCDRSAVAWTKVNGWLGMLGTEGITTTANEYVEVVMPDMGISEADKADAYTNKGDIIGWRYDGCYFAPNYYPVGDYPYGIPHTDTLQFSATQGGWYYNMTVRDSALFASNNCAIQSGSISGMTIDHSYIVGGNASKSRYPATGIACPDGYFCAINGSGSNLIANDSVIIGLMTINAADTPRPFAQVTNTRVNAALPAHLQPLSGEWTVDTSLSGTNPPMPAYPNDAYLNVIWSGSAPPPTPMPTYTPVPSATPLPSVSPGPTPIPGDEIINENFNGGASGFSAISGGTWAVSNGRYTLTSPANAEPLGNISLHSTAVNQDFIAKALCRVANESAWDDFVVIFGYQNSLNYYFASFAEADDENCNGIFKVQNGVKTELVNFSSTTSAGADHDVSILCYNGNIVVFRDSVQIGAVSDNTFTGGKIGLGSKNNTCEFDNFIVTGVYSEGTPTPAPTPTPVSSPTPAPTPTPTSEPGSAIVLEAENYSSMYGISNAGSQIGNCDTNDWVRFDNINLDAGYDTFIANLGVPASEAGKSVEVRLDSTSGTLLGTLVTQSTGDWYTFQQQSTTLAPAGGTHSVYFVFKGGYGVGSFDWFKLTRGTATTPTPSPTSAPTPTPTPASSPTPTPSPTAVPGSAIVLEAENYNSMNGISNAGTYIGSCDINDWVRFDNINLDAGYNTFAANLGVPASNAGMTVEVRLDSTSGTLIGTLVTQSTGDWYTFQQQSTTLSPASGTHSIYFVFKGGYGVGSFDWFKLTGGAAPTPTPTPTPTPASSPAPTPSPTAVPGSAIVLEAENYNSMNGISNAGTHIGSCDINDWVRFDNINLDAGYNTFVANLGVPASNAGMTVEVRLDSTSGTLIGTLVTQSTGDWYTFQQQSTALAPASGTHSVYFVFKGGYGVGSFDWFEFRKN